MTNGKPDGSTTTKSPLLGEAALLAALSVSSYCLAYAYETGYASYFGFPDWIVDVRLATALGVFIAVLTVAAWIGVMVFGVVVFGNQIPASGPTLLIAMLRQSLGCVGLLIALYAVLHDDIRTIPLEKWGFIVMTILAVGLLVHELQQLIIGTWRRPESMTVIAYWQSIVSERVASNIPVRKPLPLDDSILGPLIRRPWLAAIMTVALVAFPTTLLLAAVRSFGKFSASHETQFLVSAEADTLILLRRHGDLIVAAKMDLRYATVCPIIMLLTPGDAAKRHWRAVDFGYKRLKVVRPTLPDADSGTLVGDGSPVPETFGKPGDFKSGIWLSQLVAPPRPCGRAASSEP